MSSTVPSTVDSSILLYWIPLGAGGWVVPWCGRLYEAIAASVAHRPRCRLYHSAVEVRRGSERFVIEMTPAWGVPSQERGVVCNGPVGSRWLGRSVLFRYEVRLWRNGIIPDEVYAVDGPRVVSRDDAQATQLLALVPQVPSLTWGRDESQAGEMWNSNSLVAWLLASSGHDVDAIHPPVGGRAPGWSSGLLVARQDAHTALRSDSARDNRWRWSS